MYYLYILEQQRAWREKGSKRALHLLLPAWSRMRPHRSQFPFFWQLLTKLQLTVGKTFQNDVEHKMLLKTHKCKLPVLPPTQTSECELFSRKFMQFESWSLCPLTECKKCPSMFMQQIKKKKKYFKPSSTRDFTLLISFLEYLPISTALRHCLTTRPILTYGRNYIESMMTVKLCVTTLKGFCCCLTL